MGDAEAAWLRDFDKKWDSKEEGRVQTDAYERLSDPGLHAPLSKAAIHRAELCPTPEARSISRIELEATLLRAATEIARFTVPRQTKSGWSIHVVLKCGQRVRAHFDDLDGATQAYEAIEEFLLWFTKG